MRTPVSFSTAFAQLSQELPQNQTVMDLAYDFQGQMEIIEKLQSEPWQQSKFIPLVGAGSNSRISLPLYAGDGLVVKITPARYESRAPTPCVLPHILNESVEGQYSSYWLTAYPMLNRAGIYADDVAYLAQQLKEGGYAFQDQDDRPDNLGRLPNGRVCVLDQGAVRSERGVRTVPGVADAWLTYVHDLYGDLYGQKKLPPQSADTDFTIKPRGDIIEALHKRAGIDTIEPQPVPGAEKAGSVMMPVLPRLRRMLGM